MLLPRNTDTPPFAPAGPRPRGCARLAGWRSRRVAHRPHRAVLPVLAVLAAGFFAAACEDKPVEPEEPPPDLTGSYTLVSLTQAGQTGTPPTVTGTFMVRQTKVEGQEASGTMAMKVTIALSDPPGVIEDEGTYKNRYDGTWEQTGQVIQSKGTYTFSGDTLTVMVTEPALAVSTTIWKKG